MATWCVPPCGWSRALRSHRQRNVARPPAARGTAGVERRRWVGVAPGRSPGSRPVWRCGARGMIVIVLHEPQDLVNIAHVVRGMKNFGLRDLRLVNPREYEAYRIEGIAHQTQDVLAHVRTYPSFADALADCVHVVGFTARGRTAKRRLQRPLDAAAEVLSQAGCGPRELVVG